MLVRGGDGCADDDCESAGVQALPDFLRRADAAFPEYGTVLAATSTGRASWVYVQLLHGRVAHCLPVGADAGSTRVGRQVHASRDPMPRSAAAATATWGMAGAFPEAGE